MRILLSFLGLFFACDAFGQMLHADRDASAWWQTAGVQPTYLGGGGYGVGGAAVGTYPDTNIPYRTDITLATAYGVVADGVTDDTAALNAAIAATPNGGVCKLPAGTLLISGLINQLYGKTIRGEGQDVTIINSTNTYEAISFMPYWGGQFRGMPYAFSSFSVDVTGGATRGSTSITLSTATDIGGYGALSVGDLFVITETDQAGIVDTSAFNGTFTANGWDGTGANRSRGQTVQVTSISGTTIGITPALLIDYNNTPKVTRTQGGPTQGAGIESLTLYRASQSTWHNNFWFENSANCWLYDVKSDFTTRFHVEMRFSVFCEIRKCWFLDGFQHGSGDDLQVGIRHKTSASLIEDNIVERLHIGILCDTGAAGNVIAFNYCFAEYDDTEASGNRGLYFSITSNHGAHAQYNLFEGNVAQKFTADSFWGSSSHNTVLRNWFLGHGTSHSPYSARGTAGTPYELTNYRRAVDLWLGNSSYSFFGNVLGDSTMSDATYSVTLGTDSRSDGSKYIFQMDYYYNALSTDYVGGVDPGSPSNAWDGWEISWDTDNWGERSSQTVARHGNWDAVSGGQRWETTNTNVGDYTNQTIPTSYFRSSKPSWFGNKPWPNQNPAAPTFEPTDLPAAHRRINGNESYISGGGTGTATVTNLNVGTIRLAP